ncbi:hypothetical protein DQ04_17761000 [Trypanosoma grayi]|uniref:hypothetical protein n=1 Tax=Trypanosoma grayi TaxID=71804 RepID=UPI0004F4B328|nr:hypothetical protein DQ04_17761000 [Trypanosoma grayi]KEG05862.1 hypothetical protein DQ04_17761000 [Trypanosoma grayi]
MATELPDTLYQDLFFREEAKKKIVYVPIHHWCRTAMTQVAEHAQHLGGALAVCSTMLPCGPRQEIKSYETVRGGWHAQHTIRVYLVCGGPNIIIVPPRARVVLTV